MNQRVDYLASVNRAIDHIVAHLEQPLVLADVARVAAFSPFHFHRVFSKLVGETLASFVRRLRLERALGMMARAADRDGGPNLTEIALACGFSSSSDFSRAFKQRYGLPPSAYDLSVHRVHHRDALAQRFPDQRLQRLPPGENPDGFRVTVRELPARHVAYIRVLQPYRGGVLEACERMVAWARARQLERGQWLGYTWDDPELVALDDCRYDVGVVLPGPRPPDGEVGVIALPALRVAELAIDGPIDLEMRALDWLYGTWLPGCGAMPDEQPCFEAWRGVPFVHGTERFTLSLQLPLR
jgi:AraC family transcriptional regulator